MTPLYGAGPQTAGMLRICKGQEERHIWPVHLGGWLAMGWRVAGAEAPAASRVLLPAEPPAPIAVAAGDQLEQDDAKPASTRGRRGRRRKEEQEQPPAAVEATPEPIETTAEAGVADSEPLAATDLAAESTSEPGDDSTAEGEAAAPSALPDDLFGDSLI